MVKALQTPFAPLTELARTNMELWEKMQAAARDAFVNPAKNAGSSGDPTHNDKTHNDKEKGQAS